jgi:hypothetical protein
MTAWFSSRCVDKGGDKSSLGDKMKIFTYNLRMDKNVSDHDVTPSIWEGLPKVILMTTMHTNGLLKRTSSWTSKAYGAP